MSALDLLECLGCKIHTYMVVKRNKKAQQFFLALTLKYGAITRFWNEIPVIQSPQARAEVEARRKRENAVRSSKRQQRRKKKSHLTLKPLQHSNAPNLNHRHDLHLKHRL